MAQPDLNLSFKQDADDITIGTVTDITTDYGTGSVEARADAANYLLWSKTDKDGARVFDNPASGNEFTIMQWEVNTPKDGYYEGILLRIQPYNYSANYVEQQTSGSIITQYASVFYYETTDKVYKAIAASSGQDPENTDYFEEVTDLSTIIDNTTIQKKIVDFYTRPRAARAASILMGKLDDENCPTPNAKDRDKAYYIDGLIISADAEFEQLNPREMDRIIRLIEKKTASITTS